MFVVQYPHAIEEVGDLIIFGNDMCCILLSYRIDVFFWICLYQIIQRYHGPAPCMVSLFGIRMAGIIENLIFQTYRRAFSLVQFCIHIIFDADYGFRVPEFMEGSTWYSISKMKSSSNSFVVKKLFGVLLTVAPTIVP
jgi:hypothetical protein